MADTRRVMHVIEGSDAEAGLVFALLAADSQAEATTAYTLLRGSVSEPELLLLANLREVLSELPVTPFRAGEPLDILARAGGYQDTGRSYRRLFETSAGVFGLEFVGRGNQCDEIAVHTSDARRSLRDPDETLDQPMLALFVRHAIVLDALLEALGLLGCSLQPTIYVTTDDFLAENARATVGPSASTTESATGCTGAAGEPRGHVMVIGGAGVASALMRRLALAGWQVSSGALNMGDADQVMAEALGIEYARIPPFAPMDAEAGITVAKIAERVAAIVVCDVPFGRGNVDNLLVAVHARKPLVLVGSIEGRDFAGGAAASYWAEALSAGALVVSRNSGVEHALAQVLSEDRAPT